MFLYESSLCAARVSSPTLFCNRDGNWKVWRKTKGSRNSHRELQIALQSGHRSDCELVFEFVFCLLVIWTCVFLKFFRWNFVLWRCVDDNSSFSANPPRREYVQCRYLSCIVRGNYIFHWAGVHFNMPDIVNFDCPSQWSEWWIASDNHHHISTHTSWFLQSL